MIERSVVIDCFPESVARYDGGWNLVVVDVIRATTTAVTAVATGRRCFPVPSLPDAWRLAATLKDPLMVGELSGLMPDGFDLNNSPADLELRKDIERPAVMLSSSGTQLMTGAAADQVVYVASLRNHTAVAGHVAREHSRVAIIGAGSRGQFREEDQLCCAWIAARLTADGFRPLDPRTRALVEYWEGAPLSEITTGASAAYLQRSGQSRDLEFILSHVDDLDLVCRFNGVEVVGVPSAIAAPGAAAIAVR